MSVGDRLVKRSTTMQLLDDKTSVAVYEAQSGYLEETCTWPLLSDKWSASSGALWHFYMAWEQTNGSAQQIPLESATPLCWRKCLAVLWTQWLNEKRPTFCTSSSTWVNCGVNTYADAAQRCRFDIWAEQTSCAHIFQTSTGVNSQSQTKNKKTTQCWGLPQTSLSRHRTAPRRTPPPMDSCCWGGGGRCAPVSCTSTISLTSTETSGCCGFRNNTWTFASSNVQEQDAQILCPACDLSVRHRQKFSAQRDKNVQIYSFSQNKALLSQSHCHVRTRCVPRCFPALIST